MRYVCEGEDWKQGRIRKIVFGNSVWEANESLRSQGLFAIRIEARPSLWERLVRLWPVPADTFRVEDERFR